MSDGIASVDQMMAAGMGHAMELAADAQRVQRMQTAVMSVNAYSAAALACHQMGEEKLKARCLALLEATLEQIHTNAGKTGT